MKYLAIYYVIGVLVSLYHIYYYRLSEKTKDEPQKGDGIGAIIGPWLWPVQIVLHQFTKKRKKY
jgi:hypothetical protein